MNIEQKSDYLIRFNMSILHCDVQPGFDSGIRAK